MQNYKELEPADRVIIALDMEAQEALDLAEKLQGEARWVKIGMTLFYKEGPAFVQKFKDMGYKVFIDLKLYDIPHQVQGAIGSLVSIGADMLTMHASGGVEMMSAAQKAVEQATGKGDVPITLGVTVLTSMDAETLAATGVVRPVEEQVESLALQVREAGLTGVVASPLEAPMLRRVLGPDAFIVTPGVRPAGADMGDQSRVTTPAQAFENGASHLVIGRPITGAEDPRQAFLDIVEQL